MNLMLLRRRTFFGRKVAMYWRTITGTAPIILAAAMSHALQSLTQYGKVEQRNLPQGYTELDYIRSDGSQYIDLNTTLNQDDVIEIEFEITTSQKAKSIFGYRAGASTNNIMLFFGGTTNQVFIDFNSSDYSPYRLSYDVSANTRYKAVISKSRRAIIAADGTVLAENTTACPDTITCQGAYLFAAAGSPAYADGSACRVYSCVINGKRNLVGAKDASNVVGMYDKVSEAPFVNAGTGAFTAGTDATPSPEHSMDLWTNNGAIKVRRPSGMPIAYQMVEWLKSTDAIPITGFKTKSTQEITTVFYRESSASSYLYWSDTASSGATNTTAYLTSGAGNWRWDGKTYSIGVSSGIKITSIQNKDGVWLNGTKYGYYTDAGEFVSTNDLSLFSYTNTVIRIYSMTIREGETVTLDLVPVQRLSDGTYGFYDKVSGTFYTNADATFEAGDPIADPIEIYTDGEDEVLTVRGENLFDASSYVEIKAYVNANTGVLTAGSSGSLTQYCAVIPCKPNTNYNITGQGASAWGAFTSDSIGTTATAFTKGGSLTTGVNDRYLIGLVRANADSIDYRSTLVVQELQTVTDIPMLLGLGDYKDAAELIQGIKKGKVGIKVFDGTEAFTVSSSGAMITTIPDVAIGAPNVPLNTHFALETSPTSIAAGTQRFGASGTQIYSTNYYMKHPSISTAPEFKTWLASLFAAGTPDILVYPRATETTEQIAPHSLVTHKGTNVVEAVANVEPISLEAVYASDTPAE